MATYHVMCDPEDNIIYAGTTNKQGTKFINKTAVTEETLTAVRNHFLAMAIKENTNEVGFRWTAEAGTMTLKFVIEEGE